MIAAVPGIKDQKCGKINILSEKWFFALSKL
jgi:hypothetical protein